MLNDAKKSYNQILERYRKAEKYLENTSISIEEKEKHIPEFKRIIIALDNIRIQLKESGYTMKSHEILDGFKED